MILLTINYIMCLYFLRDITILTNSLEDTMSLRVLAQIVLQIFQLRKGWTRFSDDLH